MMRKGFLNQMLKIAKGIIGVAIFLFVLNILSVTAQAEILEERIESDYRDVIAITDDGLYKYSITYYNDGHTESYIFKYLGHETEVVIPAYIDGVPVDGLGALFEGNTSIVSVVIPDTVTFIANNLFFGCTNLSSVTLSKNLKVMTGGVFWNTPSLSTLEIPSSVTDITSAIFVETGLTTVYFPASLKQVDISGLVEHETPVHLYFYSFDTKCKVMKFSNYHDLDNSATRSVSNSVSIIHCYEGSAIDEWAKSVNFPSNQIVYFDEPYEGNITSSNNSANSTVSAGGENSHTLPNTAAFDNRNVLMMLFLFALIQSIIISFAKRNLDK